MIIFGVLIHYPDAAVTPLLEIRLELVPPSIHFVPDFGYIKDMIDGWMEEFFKVLQKRKKRNEGQNKKRRKKETKGREQPNFTPNITIGI